MVYVQSLSELLHPTFLKAFFKVLIASLCSFGLYFNCLYGQDKCLVCGLVVLWWLAYLFVVMLFCFLLIMMKFFIYYPFFSCFALLYMMVVRHFLFIASFAFFLLWIMVKHFFLFLHFCYLCLKNEEELVPAVQFFFFSDYFHRFYIL